MKNLFLIVLIFVLTCGCSAPKMTNSIWCTIDPVQNNKQEGLRITSLYMFDNGNVDIYNSIISDSSMVVAPHLTAKGAYTISGNMKKEAFITLNAMNRHHQKINCTGIIDLKKKSMLLINPDSTTSMYYKYGNLKIK